MIEVVQGRCMLQRPFSAFSAREVQRLHHRQPLVCHDIAGQIGAGERRIIGVMIESNLVGGSEQEIRSQRRSN